MLMKAKNINNEQEQSIIASIVEDALKTPHKALRATIKGCIKSNMNV